LSNGSYKTDKKEDIERFLSYLQVEKEVLDNSISFDQMADFIDGEMSDGKLGSLSNGDKLLTGVDFTRESGAWKADQKTVDRTWHEVQGYLTPDATDPRTVGKNIVGSFPGGNNPQKYNGSYDYSIVPSNIEEYPAIGHDRRYDNL
jgi:hypothetical protein